MLKYYKRIIRSTRVFPKQTSHHFYYNIANNISYNPLTIPSIHNEGRYSLWCCRRSCWPCRCLLGPNGCRYSCGHWRGPSLSTHHLDRLQHWIQVLWTAARRLLEQWQINLVSYLRWKCHSIEVANLNGFQLQ